MTTQISRRNFVALGLAGLAGSSVPKQLFAQPAVSSAADPALAAAFKDEKYALPPLPYSYDALEPLYQRRALEIHYTVHHAGSINGLNKTLDSLRNAAMTSDFSAIKFLCRDLAFHGSGHILHCLFWHSMTPSGSAIPNALAAILTGSFGSIETAKAQFAAAAKAVEANGWAVLCYEPTAKKLLILQSEKHQNLAIWGVIPLLVCDVWEHAYYLQYAADRAKWVDSFMKVANWQFAADRMALAQRL